MVLTVGGYIIIRTVNCTSGCRRCCRRRRRRVRRPRVPWTTRPPPPRPAPGRRKSHWILNHHPSPACNPRRTGNRRLPATTRHPRPRRPSASRTRPRHLPGPPLARVRSPCCTASPTAHTKKQYRQIVFFYFIFFNFQPVRPQNKIIF